MTDLWPSEIARLHYGLTARGLNPSDFDFRVVPGGVVVMRLSNGKSQTYSRGKLLIDEIILNAGNLKIQPGDGIMEIVADGTIVAELNVSDAKSLYDWLGTELVARGR